MSLCSVHNLLYWALKYREYYYYFCSHLEPNGHKPFKAPVLKLLTLLGQSFSTLVDITLGNLIKVIHENYFMHRSWISWNITNFNKCNEIDSKMYVSMAVINWKPGTVMIPIYLSLAAPQVVVMTTCNTTNDDRVGNTCMTALGTFVSARSPSPFRPLPVQYFG